MKARYWIASDKFVRMAPPAEKRIVDTSSIAFGDKRHIFYNDIVDFELWRKAAKQYLSNFGEVKSATYQDIGDKIEVPSSIILSNIKGK